MITFATILHPYHIQCIEIELSKNLSKILQTNVTLHDYIHFKNTNDSKINIMKYNKINNLEHEKI